MMKLKLQYSGHLMWRTDSLGKTQMLVKVEGRRRMGVQKMRWLDGITNSQTLGVGDGQRSLIVHGVTKSQTWINDWTELNSWIIFFFYQYGIIFFICLLSSIVSFVFSFQEFNYDVFCLYFLWVYFICVCLSSWICTFMSLAKQWEIFSHYFSYVPFKFHLITSSETLFTWVLYLLQ